MEPITWSMVAGLLIKYGPEVTEYIVKKIQGGGPVTPEEWAELKALAEKTPKSQLLEAFARAGIAESDPKAAALLAMLPK